jgi:predicted LPLAT superfamily acyltransferase
MSAPVPPPAPAAAPARASGERWVRERERGSALALRIMMFLSLRLGRPVGRALLYLIAGYFFVFAPSERRASIAYLTRILGRRPRAAERFRHTYTFATTILDRLFLVNERYELLDVSIEGEALMQDLLTRHSGAILLGAHLGSFEMMSAVGRRQPGLRTAMAMYAEQASLVAELFGAGCSPNAPQIITLGHLDAMLRIRDCLDQGHMVGMLADRTFGESQAEVLPFLGSPALFPSGPMRAAAAMRCPVIFMTGLYRGDNRYQVVFRQIADFSQAAPPGGRGAQVRAAIEAYVRLLEEFCRTDPYNWFNFYDFWHGAPVTETP